MHTTYIAMKSLCQLNCVQKEKVLALDIDYGSRKTTYHCDYARSLSDADDALVENHNYCVHW